MTATYTKTGTKATTPVKLDKTVFGVIPQNHELLKSAYVAYLANGRTSAGNTKTRGLVRGGGKKPWKQKGTGRARFGSSRNPIWRGGGIVFGPSGNENYAHKMHTTAKRQALRQALSVASQENLIIVIENVDLKSGKTSDAIKLFTKIGTKGNILLVVPDKTLEIVRSTNNLPNVKVVKSSYLNVYDVMNADSIVIASDALKLISEHLSPVKKTVTKLATQEAK